MADRTEPLSRAMTRHAYSMGAPSFMVLPLYFIAGAVLIATGWLWELLPVALAAHLLLRQVYRKDEYYLKNLRERFSIPDRLEP